MAGALQAVPPGGPAHQNSRALFSDDPALYQQHFEALYTRLNQICRNVGVDKTPKAAKVIGNTPGSYGTDPDGHTLWHAPLPQTLDCRLSQGGKTRSSSNGLCGAAEISPPKCAWCIVAPSKLQGYKQCMIWPVLCRMIQDFCLN